jgi:hypothetical protein
MANEDKSSPNLTNAGAVFAAIVAAGFYFLHQEAPLIDSRPAAPESYIRRESTPQNVSARLWQDPIEAVDKDLRKQDREEKCDEPLATPSCMPPVSRREKDTLILGVTISGAPYSEDAEQRRRTRYAVLAGLERAGFVPKDARHIGYFHWRPDRILIEDSLPPISAELPFFAWPRKIQQSRQFSITAEETPDHFVIPYEKFERGEEDIRRVLVLWLSEDILRGQPLSKLSKLASLLHRPNSDNFRIVGPFSSDLLRDMVTEAYQHKSPEHPWSDLGDMRFYAYGASASDRELLKGVQIGIRVEKFLAQYGIHLSRTIASDDTVAGGLAKELSRRDIKSSDPIVMISEWDTLFGRTLPLAVEKALEQESSRTELRKFTYLRGLDGLLPFPNQKDSAKQATTTGSKKEQTDTTPPSDFFKAEGDTKRLERPLGESQFDYLRRISSRLHEIDGEFRKQDPYKRIKAIGILGSDVFDKLLILRALRPEFPESIFFTTDFDQALTIDSELPFTRNLIVSSSFGPNLSEKFQGGIPSFRDTYQTAAFLATLSAIGDPEDYWNTSAPFLADIEDQLKAPRLFEITRTGDILSFPWERSPPETPAEKKFDPVQEESSIAATNIRGRSSVRIDDWPCWKSEPTGCGYIHPIKDIEDSKRKPEQPKIIEELFPTYEEKSRIKLKYGLAASAFLALGSLALQRVRRLAGLEVGLLSLSFGAGALACALWEPLARVLTEDGMGEPLTIFEGVSVWPTVMIRILSILLAICFIIRAFRTLHGNLRKIALEMELTPPVPLKEQMADCLADLQRMRKSVLRLFRHSKEDIHLSDKPACRTQVAWERYITRERFWPRLIRALTCTGLMYGLTIFVLVPVFGPPVNPGRGHLAPWLLYLTTRADVLLMLILTFVILDATASCLFFINKLQRIQSAWPSETEGVYSGRLRLPPNFLRKWINLDLVAKRTDCIGSLIYFPFILIALLVISRSSIFANYAPNLAIIVAQGISLFFVLCSAIMLCWAARGAQEITKQNLIEGVISAEDPSEAGRHAEQLKILLERVDQLKEGAFGPFRQQPLVRALLWPLSGIGWTTLMENGMFPGL